MIEISAMKLRALSRHIGIGLSFFTSMLALAALKAPDFTVQTAVSGGKISVQVKAPAGHHFNTDAPMSLELESTHSRIKPKSSAPTQVTFEVPSAAKDSAKVALYLCDDAKTFCEKHQVSIAWEGKAGAAPTSKSKTAQGEKTSSHHRLLDEHGFYDNRPEEAFAQARAQGKPLLIDFYGIWCPPCNELNDRVFSQPTFKKEADAFVRLKMDADAAVSEALSQRYGIQGFPTVIFASPEGDEIGRVVGYRPIDRFLSDMKGALAGQRANFTTLKKKAEKGDRAASDRAGLMYLDRGEYAQAYRFLNGTTQEREKMRAAEIGLASQKAKSGDEAARAQWMKALRETIRDFPDSPDSITYREDLAKAYDETKNTEDANKVRQDLVAAAKRLLTKPEVLKGYDCSEGDLYTSMAEAYSALGDKAQAVASWTSAAEFYRKKIAAGGERGGTLELAYCLRQLGQTDEAAKLYQKMQKAYPNEFTFWLADAKMNMQLKNFDRARTLAQSAYDHSYGANKLDSALVLANAWKELKKPDQSRKVIAQALESVPPLPPTANQAARSRIRTKMESLQQLSAELTKTSG
jgi:tetratricopeptide (TPR) repeat protein/thiol-disulfide isomerase/thioredoxin